MTSSIETDNIIDLPRLRRQRFEKTKSEEELEQLDFDDFGHPVHRFPENVVEHMEPIQPVDVKELLGPYLEQLMRTDPAFCRRMGLIPRPILLRTLEEPGLE